MRSAAAIIGPAVDAHRARRQRRPVVHRVDRLDREAIEQAVVDHRLGAGEAFFAGLEDQHGGCRRSRVSRPGSAPRPPASWCGRRGRSRASGRGRRAPGEVVLLDHRQRVHVGAQADWRALDAPRRRARHATTPVRPMPSWISSTPATRSAVDHARRGAALLEAELRVGVQVTAKRRQLAMPARPAAGRRRRRVDRRSLQHHQCPPCPTRCAGADRPRSTAGRRSG